MAEPAEKRWTVEEFLAWDDDTDRRYELVDGQIAAMAPPSEAHATIVVNLGGELQPAQTAVPCRRRVRGQAAGPGRQLLPVRPGGDLRAGRSGAALYRRAGADRRGAVALDWLHDRGRKLDHYRQLPSLKEVILVASEERRVQHWRRNGARWTVDDLIGDADLRLATVADPIPLATIYEGSGV